MSNAELHYKPITEQAAMLRAGELSPLELTQAYLDRIDALDGELGAYITVMADHALAQARQAEAELQAGADRGALHGIPIAVKDIIHTKGTLTSGGSKVLADFVPDEDSTIVRRLDAAGATLLGKLNLSEFAIGGTIDHPFRRSAQSVEHGTHGGRLQQRLRRGGGGWSVRGRAGFGHGRQRARSRRLLRHRGAASDLRQGYAARRHPRCAGRWIRLAQ